MFIQHYVSCVMCHVSRVTCHLSHVKIFLKHFYIHIKNLILVYAFKKLDLVTLKRIQKKKEKKVGVYHMRDSQVSFRLNQFYIFVNTRYLACLWFHNAVPSDKKGFYRCLFFFYSGHFWCSVVTSVTFCSNLSNFEKNPVKEKKIHKGPKKFKKYN